MFACRRVRRVALWATQRLFPLEHGGAFASDLSKCRQAALTLYEHLNGDPRFMTVFPHNWTS